MRELKVIKQYLCSHWTVCVKWHVATGSLFIKLFGVQKCGSASSTTVNTEAW